MVRTRIDRKEKLGLQGVGVENIGAWAHVNRCRKGLDFGSKPLSALPTVDLKAVVPMEQINRLGLLWVTMHQMRFDFCWNHFSTYPFGESCHRLAMGVETSRRGHLDETINISHSHCFSPFTHPCDLQDPSLR